MNKVLICSKNKQLLGPKVFRHTIGKYWRLDSFEVVYKGSYLESGLDLLKGQGYWRYGE